MFLSDERTFAGTHAALRPGYGLTVCFLRTFPRICGLIHVISSVCFHAGGCAVSEKTYSTMARPLNDGKPSEPVGNIQVETSHAFPAETPAETPCGGICEQSLPSSHPSTTNHFQPSFCQMCHCQINRCQITLGAENNCQESGPSSAPCGNSHCHFSGRYNTGESTALSLTHSLSENSGMEDNVRILNPDDFAGDIQGGAMLLAGEEDIEREIAMRLRRIGDQMNELYMQRRVGGERHWWGPLRWHLTRFISEILSALYNPLVDILPHH